MIISILTYNKLKEEMEKRNLYLLLIISLLFYIFYNKIEYFILSVMLNISIIDIKKKIIPNEFLIILLPFTLINIDFSFNVFKLLSIIFIIILILISHFTQIIGMGDVKLLSILYLIKGVYFMHAFFINISIVLFIFSLILVIKSKSTKKSFALAPIILLSYILTIN
ncbi:prepilin peptidase [Helcococcus kunzii]|uniref:prepilin peptidase n=1 Tax=Helcococcus kunzii TaxID=40091 RepID=UPI0038A9A5DF